MTVREGYLLKRKEEAPASLATCFAFKKRYFWLSGETLSYSKSPEWQVGIQSTVEGLPVATPLPHRAAFLHPGGHGGPDWGKDLPNAPQQLGKFKWSGQALLTPLGQWASRPGTGIHLHTLTIKRPSERTLGVAPTPPPDADPHRTRTTLTHPRVFPARSVPTYRRDSLRYRPGGRGTRPGVPSLTHSFIRPSLRASWAPCSALGTEMQQSTRWSTCSHGAATQVWHRQTRGGIRPPLRVHCK